MHTYYDISIAYDKGIYRDYTCRDKGEHIYINGEEYVVLSVEWAGWYDFKVEMCPIGLLSQFVN